MSKPLPRETELKLICGRGAGDALLQSEVITARAVGPLVTRDLVATYYDTADRQLSSRRLSLRVRQEDGRRIQTLKTAPAADAVLAERGEWQVEVAGGPDLSAFDDLPPELAIPIASADLQPLFTTKVHRKSLPVRVRSGDARHSLIEVSVDRGELQIADKASPLDEVELELVEGSPRATLELARALRRLVPLRIGAQSKSERGFLLVSGEPPAAVKAGWLELDRQLSVEAALGSVLRHCLVQALGNEAAAADGRNVEGVHQLRVALRRLRSALSLFREAMTERARLRWAAEARWLLGRLGPSRDLDVLLTELLPPLGETLQADPSLDALLALAEAARDTARSQARAALLARRSGDFLLDLACWVESDGWRVRAGPELIEAQRRPVIEFAETMLDRLHRRVRKRGRNFAQLAPGDRHRLRIACKKLRYGTEFFASLFAGRRARDYAAMLGRLQDCLGHMNDIAVTRRLVDGVMTSAPRSDRRRVSAGFAAGVVVGWHAQAATIVEPEARRLWKELKKTQPFWRRPE